MLATEHKIDLADAAKLVPGHPHASTLWRWSRRGIKARDGSRVRLEHVRLGGKVFTSREAIERFGAALAAADAAHFDPPAPPPKGRTDAQRRRAVDRATAELAEAGI
jgi:hypothetical protein